jgi:hypothetical protein
VNPPEQAGPPNARRPKIMAFRKRSGTPLPTPEQSRRQGDVVRSGAPFRRAGSVIAFNTGNRVMNGRPHLAIRRFAKAGGKRGCEQTTKTWLGGTILQRGGQFHAGTGADQSSFRRD